MRHFFIVFLLLITTCTYCQDLSEATYLKVVELVNTTDDSHFVVVSVKNLNTGQTKEICTEISSLCNAIIKETKDTAIDNIKQYLVSHSSKRTFEIKNNEALKLLKFDTCSLKSEDSLASIITQGHIIDSLMKISEYRRNVILYFFDLENKNEEIVGQIKDSIMAHRPLDQKELRLIEDLNNNSDYDFADISENGKELISYCNNRMRNINDAYKHFNDGVVVDSFENNIEYREDCLTKVSYYKNQRIEIINEICDSIAKGRPLDKDEIVILDNILEEQYNYLYIEYSQLSENERILVDIRNSKIKFERDQLSNTANEITRMESIFVKEFFKKYNANFPHIAFRFGAIFKIEYYDDSIYFCELLEKKE